MSVILSPSILSADFSRLGEEIRTVEKAGVDWIHIDVMDGHFVPNMTMGPFIVETCKRITSLPLDVHLMIDNADKFVEIFARAGAGCLSVHLEGNPNIHRTLQVVRSLGVKTGLVLNPGTPVEASSAVVHLVDYVLLMSVNPGYSGQSFQPETVKRVKQMRSLLDSINPNASIEVDGGVTADNIKELNEAGADIFVAATSIFKHPLGAMEGVRALRKALD
ncbi:ribulose-phosphate 3-epimerase [Leptolinea tardivitalis]|uniref:Ribulose-phosphate 3-epimerase n=1 Tax=Leptolinea tardivitalis TaxID=229920 RepID=A0A0P6WYM3_9CHLR|nr:ribulose-phosphate 3-epimerase [Leptolinea tardivitalis]KPL71715.1 ribulose-phosphate 3-epimerase [Leptolinea tardivitalis]GAP20069.1 ribulose-5-phosphate 3-epimerase [Leptolinea tardivitalis]